MGDKQFGTSHEKDFIKNHLMNSQLANAAGTGELDIPFSGKRPRKCRQQIEDMVPKDVLQGCFFRGNSNRGALQQTQHKIEGLSDSKLVGCDDDASTHLPSKHDDGMTQASTGSGDDDDNNGDTDANAAVSPDVNVDCNDKFQFAVKVVGPKPPATPAAASQPSTKFAFHCVWALVSSFVARCCAVSISSTNCTKD